MTMPNRRRSFHRGGLKIADVGFRDLSSRSLSLRTPGREQTASSCPPAPTLAAAAFSQRSSVSPVDGHI
jgi:hypothetical protein